MSNPGNTIDIYKLLPKTNCRECGLPTCMALAAAVFKGHKDLSACPYLDRKIVKRYIRPESGSNSIEDDMQKAVRDLQKKIPSIDLAAAAKRLDGQYNGRKLTLKILGKPFSVDDEGHMSSDIHVHPWIAIPILSYILEGQNAPLSGKWVPFRELSSGKDWQRLYAQRCEKPLKQVADTYPELFEDMIHLFNGQPVERHYQSDISLVLWPLPKVPMLICYWKPDEGLDSDLNVFFDSNAEQILSIESLYALATGMVRMFEKLAFRHGY